MVKTLRTIIPNQKGLTPRDGKEKDLAAQHSVEVIGDANGNDDAVFKASKVKTIDRSATRQGNDTNDDVDKLTKKNERTGGPLTAASEEEINVLAVDFDEDDENDDLHQAIVEANSELNEEDHDRWMHSDAFINHSQHAVDANRKASNSLMHSNKELDPLLRDHHAELHQIYKKAATKHLKIAAYHAKKCGMKEGVDYVDTVAKFAEILKSDSLNKEDLEEANHQGFSKKKVLSLRKASAKGTRWENAKTINDPKLGKITIPNNSSRKG